MNKKNEVIEKMDKAIRCLQEALDDAKWAKRMIKKVDTDEEVYKFLINGNEFGWAQCYTQDALDWLGDVEKIVEAAEKHTLR